VVREHATHIDNRILWC